MLMPQSALAEEPETITLNNMRISFNGTFFPVAASTDGSTFTIEGTTKTKESYDIRNYRLYFTISTGENTAWGGKSKNIKIDVPYLNTSGINLDGQGLAGEYLGANADPSYYLFDFYLSDAGKARTTKYTLRVRKYVPDIVETSFLSMWVGINRVGQKSFSPVAGAANLHEMVLAENVSAASYSAAIVCNNYYKNSAYLDGTSFTAGEYRDGMKRTLVFTRDKPYYDFHFVPGSSAHTLYETYIPATWRLRVSFTAQAPTEETKPGSAAASSIEMQKSLNLAVGKSLKLPYAVTFASSIESRALTWASSNKKAVSVTQKGLVKGLKPGKSKVTVKTADGKSASCTVRVVGREVPITGIRIKPGLNKSKTVTLKVGSEKRFTATPLPAGATAATASWASSKKSVARVDALGRVTALKKGKCTLTVKMGRQKVKINIIVR